MWRILTIVSAEPDQEGESRDARENRNGYFTAQRDYVALVIINLLLFCAKSSSGKFWPVVEVVLDRRRRVTCRLCCTLTLGARSGDVFSFPSVVWLPPPPVASSITAVNVECCRLRRIKRRRIKRRSCKRSIA
jgi:hypothetical protein